MDASKYFKKGKNMNELREEDITRIVEGYKNRVNIDKFAYKATLSEVKEDNDYNCNIPRYVDTFEEEKPINLEEVTQKIESTRKEINEAETVLKGFFSELGLRFPEVK